MTSPRPDAPGPSRPVDRPGVYTVHVGALLGPDWVDWFEGGEILGQDDGTARIIVEVRDQAMLFGLLIRIRDLGVPLLGLFPGRHPGGEVTPEWSREASAPQDPGVSEEAGP